VKWWPFSRKRQEEESYFASSEGAKVAPAGPPVVEDQGAVPQRSAAASPSATDRTSGAEADVLESLAAAGIHIPTGANVQIATHATELTGEQAAQFLSQIGALLGSAGSTRSVQVHPGIQIVSEGQVLESPEKLRAEGVDAQATVKDLEEKPVTIGDTRIVELRLEVTMPGREPYDVHTAALVPAKVTEEFAEGKTFRAKVDPNDPQQVLVLWNGS
jgi:hypothetical protein